MSQLFCNILSRVQIVVHQNQNQAMDTVIQNQAAEVGKANGL